MHVCMYVCMYVCTLIFSLCISFVDMFIYCLFIYFLYVESNSDHAFANDSCLQAAWVNKSRPVRFIGRLKGF